MEDCARYDICQIKPNKSQNLSAEPRSHFISMFNVRINLKSSLLAILTGVIFTFTAFGRFHYPEKLAQGLAQGTGSGHLGFELATSGPTP